MLMIIIIHQKIKSKKQKWSLKELSHPDLNIAVIFRFNIHWANLNLNVAPGPVVVFMRLENKEAHFLSQLKPGHLFSFYLTGFVKVESLNQF